MAGRLEDLLVAKLNEVKKQKPKAVPGQAPPDAQRLSSESVRIVYSTLRALLFAAVDDEVLGGNPAAKLGKMLHLVTSKATRQERIRALDRTQLDRFLDAVAAKEPRPHPFLFTISRTGMRLGEALALQVGRRRLRGAADPRRARRISRRGPRHAEERPRPHPGTWRPRSATSCCATAPGSPRRG